MKIRRYRGQIRPFGLYVNGTYVARFWTYSDITKFLRLLELEDCDDSECGRQWLVGLGEGAAAFLREIDAQQAVDDDDDDEDVDVDEDDAA